MRFSMDNIFGVHEQALIARSKRAEVIAANLSNVDTPGYKARDMDFESVLKASLSGVGNGAGGIEKTHSQHMSVNGGPNGSYDLLYRVPLQPSVDGNTVDAQTEQANFSQNAVQYQATYTFLNGTISGLRTAIRGE